MPITHNFSSNPFEPNTDPKVAANGTMRATWQHRNTSIVWAKVHQSDLTGNGAVTVDPTAIAWLLLDGVGSQNGPTGGDKLTNTTTLPREFRLEVTNATNDCGSYVESKQ